jgi:hypothetical protein
MKTPVALIIFKRKDTTEKVFEAIRQAKPPKLFVIADGPRDDHDGEAEKCEATRAIIDRVDWDCEVFKNYSDVNLGCARRLPTGLDWVFSQVEEAIILEDDCVPHPTFFNFCDELLERYKYDTRISLISGQNVQFGRQRNNYSYYYSRNILCWGWATWRRAWQNFDINMKLWPEIQSENFLNDILVEPAAVKHWNKVFQSVYNNPQDKVWDYQWVFACWVQNSLGIIPNVNLISNIGFGADSTHFESTQKSNPYHNMPREEMKLPLNHPPFVIRDDKADRFTQINLYEGGQLQRFKQGVKDILKEFIKPLQIK